jgi:hypothetical protein
MSPAGPATEAIVQGERLVDRILDQDDVPLVPFI